MSWVKLDDNIADHPKFVGLSPESAWLFICGLCYCNRFKTNGLIPDGVVDRLSNVRQPRRAAHRLVDVTLWESDGAGGYVVHDYSDYQPVNDKTESGRMALHSKRSEAGKRGAEKRWSGMAKCQSDSPVPVPVVKKDIPHKPQGTKNAYTEDFEEFWSAYPERKGTKYDAFMRYQKILKDGVGVDVLLRAAQNYAKERAAENDPKFTKWATTFLNKRCYEDYQGEKSDYDDPALRAWL